MGCGSKEAECLPSKHEAEYHQKQTNKNVESYILEYLTYLISNLLME
jgi:hypothetical protein